MGKIAEIQRILGFTGPDADDQWGPKSETALRSLIRMRPVPKAPVWPFSFQIVGDDLLVQDVVITCFGGWGSGHEFDPQDDGGTASGMNTKNQRVEGVSIAMDGRDFPSLRPAEHRALDFAPIPRLRNDKGLTAWHTPVEILIPGSAPFIPKDGIVDLGPGLQASKPGEPHALDLTIPAAMHYDARGRGPAWLTRNFETRGSFRIIGGAKLLRS